MGIPQRRQLWLASLVAALVAGVVLLFTMGAGRAASTAPNVVEFKLHPNAKFLACLRGRERTPTASVRVQRGQLNDELKISLKGFKPHLAFDLFTVQRSSLLANGEPDPAFKGSFGLAWYQSDIEVNGGGNADARIKTILLDQIFGFDPDVTLPPTNTFHVGFWFNDPRDAEPCGFTGFTPFNGEHHAGPLAFISVPNAETGLGPLCTKPNRSTTPASCNP
jgi:hypothetical protein